jgi:hypothetical protein
MYRKYLKEINKSDDKQNFPDYITWLNDRILWYQKLIDLRNIKPKN